MSKDKPIRVELTKQELFEAAFFIGYAAAILPHDAGGMGRPENLRDRAQKLLALLIAAESDENEPTITVEGMGVER